MKAHCDVVENLPIPMKLLVVFMLVVFVSGCKKHELDPQHAILGKWEPFYLGKANTDHPLTNQVHTGTFSLIAYCWNMNMPHKEQSRKNIGLILFLI